jgi:secreted PhoX family phosphatase
MGDDARSEYLYKFVSRDTVNLKNREANVNLVDHGTLSVAKFSDDGHVHWLPLVYGENGLTEANGFLSQADVVINARSAADLLGATPLDRPEDVVPNATNGSVYVMLTNNTARKAAEVDAVNPRPHNKFGQIIEIIEPAGDFASTKSQWNILVLAGDPTDPTVGANWHADISKNGWFACPDNGVIDPKGRLWVSTDQGSVAYKTGTNDGLWAMETQGALRGKSKMFFRCPDGAETAGPIFSNDGKALFIAIQHPGVGKLSQAQDTLHNPLTRWPDFSPSMPPRPAILVIQKNDGGEIA